MARGGHDGKTKKGGLFDDLSIAQVVAGALAAVTSMLLASQIGIYGSVIGVGVGSIVSTVASQLYKKFLQRSADKLRELNPTEIIEPKATGVDARDESAYALADDAETTALPRSAHADDALRTGDSAVRRARAEREHKRKLKRGVVIVSVVSALVAVAVSAMVIDLASSGQGVGEKTEPLLPSRSQPASTDAEAAGEQAGQEASTPSDAKADSAKDGDAATQDPGKDASDQSGADAGAGTGDGSSKPSDPDGDSGSGAQPNPGGNSSSDGGGTKPDAGSSSDPSTGGGTGTGTGSSSPTSK